MRRLPATIVLLASALPACLLYTHPINSAPRVTIVAPTSIVSGTVTFTAQASDPDGEQVRLFWKLLEKPCPGKDMQDEWQDLTASEGDSFDVMVTGHDPFCVQVIAQDPQGAQSSPQQFPGTPKNRPPKLMLAADPGPTMIPLYGPVRLTATTMDGDSDTSDEDGDPVTFTWKGTGAAGAPLALAPCDSMPADNVRCFTPDTAGTYVVSVDGSDGVMGSAPVTKMLSLSVLADTPPCIDATDPSSDIDTVVMAVTDPPRQFEVRRVRDDGNPYPPSGHGQTTFQWSTMREGDPSWKRLIGDAYDRSTFVVGASTFDDARPGSTYKVRVEVRDPAHDSMAEEHTLELMCGDKDQCFVPDACLRWVSWTVSFQ